MQERIRAIINDGKIQPLDDVSLPEGTELIVTVVSTNGDSFWLNACEPSLEAIWDNPEDDVYGELLER
jgi:predicted DNA-binding antitoxin AbrB/MazE fold protein